MTDEAIPLSELSALEAVPRTTTYSWAQDGLIYSERLAGRMMIPAEEAFVARLACRLSKRGVSARNLAWILPAIREIAPEQRRDALRDALVVRLAPDSWALYRSIDECPQPRRGGYLAAHLLGELLP